MSKTETTIDGQKYTMFEKSIKPEYSPYTIFYGREVSLGDVHVLHKIYLRGKLDGLREYRAEVSLLLGVEI